MLIEFEMSAHRSRSSENNRDIVVAGCASATFWIEDTEVDEPLGRVELLTPRAIFDQKESTRNENVSRQLAGCDRNTCSDLCLQSASVLDVQESSALTTEAKERLVVRIEGRPLSLHTQGAGC